MLRVQAHERMGEPRPVGPATMREHRGGETHGLGFGSCHVVDELGREVGSKPNRVEGQSLVRTRG
jgi:hypothetical protein